MRVMPRETWRPSTKAKPSPASVASASVVTMKATEFRLPASAAANPQIGESASLLRRFDRGGVHVARQTDCGGLQVDLLDETGFKRRQQGAHGRDMLGLPRPLGDLVQVSRNSGHGAGDLFPEHVALAGRKIGQRQGDLEGSRTDLAPPVGGGHGPDIAFAGFDGLGFGGGAGREIALLDVLHGEGDAARLRLVHGRELKKFGPRGCHLPGQVDHPDSQRLHRVKLGMIDARDAEAFPQGAVRPSAPGPGGKFRRFEPGRGIGAGRQGRVELVQLTEQPEDDFPVALVPRIGGGGLADGYGVGFDDLARGTAVFRRQAGGEAGSLVERFQGGGDLAAVGVVQERHLRKLCIDHAVTDQLDQVGEGGRGPCRQLRLFQVVAGGAGELHLGRNQHIRQRGQLLDRLADDRVARQQLLLDADEALKRLRVAVGGRLFRCHAARRELIDDRCQPVLGVRRGGQVAPKGAPFQGANLAHRQ